MLVARIHDWSGGDPALFDRFPAHMHIDLLPRAQGQGLGSPAHRDARRPRCVSAVCRACTWASTASNEGAIAFYARLGFVEAQRHEWGRTLTLDLR